MGVVPPRRWRFQSRLLGGHCHLGHGRENASRPHWRGGELLPCGVHHRHYRLLAVCGGLGHLLLAHVHVKMPNVSHGNDRTGSLSMAFWVAASRSVRLVVRGMDLKELAETRPKAT